MPPEEELFRPFDRHFEFKIKAKPHVVEWKNTQGGLAFRPRGASCDLIWFIPEFEMVEEPYRGKFDLQWNRHIIGFCSNEQFFRFVPFVHNALRCESWLVLRPDASGVICGTYAQRANWKANLNWDEDKAMFFRASLEVLSARVERAIANDLKEWERACQWAQQGDDERFWGIVCWSHGDAQQWKNLVRAAMQMAWLPDEKEKEHTWGIFVLEKPRFAFAPLRMGRGRNNHPTPVRLAPLLELLESHFRPRIDYSRSGCQWKPPFYSVLRPKRIRAEKPTQHELMEAIQLWREFGRKSEQLAQVEVGLRQLLT